MAGGIQPLLFFTEPVASWTHLGGAVVGLCLLPALRRVAGNDPVLRRCLTAFGLTVVGLLTVSGLYHLCEVEGTARAVFRRLDHVGIWLATAGCATPIWYFYLRSTRLGPAFIGVVWVVAAIAAGLKTVYLEAMPPWAGVILFVAFGSIGTPVAIWLVVSRGLRYTLPFFLCGVSLSLGAIVELIEEPLVVPGWIGYHELVHVLVMGGLFFHWRFVYRVSREALPAPEPTPAAAIQPERTAPQPVPVLPNDT